MISLSVFKDKLFKRYALLFDIGRDNLVSLVFTLLFVLYSLSSYAQLGKRDPLYYKCDGIGGNISDMQATPDGGIIIVGDFLYSSERSVNRIAKINTSGENDYTFNPGTGANGVINAVAIQADGKLIIVGNFTTYNGTARNRIARINTDGSLDVTFNVGTGCNSAVYDVLVQPDGMIVAAGGFTNYKSNTVSRIVRIKTNGDRDATFVTPTLQTLLSIDLQSDGKILLGGQYVTGYKPLNRLNADGSTDTGFNVGGTGVTAQVNRVKQLSTGQLCVTGTFATYNSVAYKGILILNQDGSVPSSFTGTSVYNGAAGSIFEQPDKKIILAASGYYDGIETKGLLRIDTTGTKDTSYYAGTETGGTFNAAIRLPNGNLIYAGGFQLFNSYSRGGLVKVDANGYVVTSFFNRSGLNGAVAGIGVQSDGKVILVGAFTKFDDQNTKYIVRLDREGRLDPTFDVGEGATAPINAIKILPDDKILIVGTFITFHSNTRQYIARLNADGSNDNGFSAASNGFLYAVDVDPQGRVYVGGLFSTFNGSSKKNIIRLLPNGSTDNSISYGVLNGTPRMVKVDANNKLLIAGPGLSYAGGPTTHAIRIDTTGGNDTSFHTSFGAYTLCVNVQNDNKVLWGGIFQQLNGATKKYVTRTLNTGYADNTWASNVTSTSGVVQSVSPYLKKGVIAAGSFTTLGTLNRNGWAYLDSIGAVDTSYFVGTGFTSGGSVSLVRTHYVDNINGRVLAGGDFVTSQNCHSPYFSGLISAYEGAAIDSIDTDSILCAGTTFDLQFKKLKNFNVGNTFTVQLSNSSGSFSSPTNIGTKTADGMGWESVTVTIPGSATSGSGYKLRVVATNAPYISDIVPVNVAAAVDTADIVGDSSIYLGMEPCYTATATNSTSITYSILGNGASIDSPGCVHDVTRSFAVVATAIGNPACPATVASKYVQVVDEQPWPQEPIDYCAFDAMIANWKLNLPGYSVERDNLDEAINEYIESEEFAEGEGDRGSGTFVIPVVFHIIHNATQAEGVGANLSYERLQWQIRALNAAFDRQYPEYNGQNHDATARVTNIQFCLANTPTGTTWTNPAQPGVMRYPSTNSNVLIVNPPTLNFNGVMPVLALTHPNGQGRFPFNMYLNVWCVPTLTDNVAGVGLPPRQAGQFWPMDGVLMQSDVIGDNTIVGNNFNMSPILQQGKILAHEVGHYLNLFHTFQPTESTCTVSNSDCAGGGAIGSGCNACDMNGDRVCDTPPCEVAEGADRENCNYVTNVCTGLNNYPSHNYMTYKADACLNAFTQGQVNRMNAVLLDNTMNRFNLWQTANLTATDPECEACIHTANIAFMPLHPCPGTQIDFATPSGTGVFCPVTYNWQFPGATPSSSTQQNPQNVVYANPGIYTVTLTTTIGSKSVTEQVQINLAMTAQIVGPTATIDACNNSLQVIQFQFSNGQPPYTYNLSNGSSFQTSYERYNRVITIGNTDETVTISSATDNACSATLSGQAIFNVIDCCPTITNNGDFSEGNTGFFTDHELTSPTTGHGDYSIRSNLGPLLQNFGNCLDVDGFTNPPHATPYPFSTIWSENVAILSNTNYNIDFLVTVANHPVPFNNPQMQLRVVIYDLLGTEVFSTFSNSDFVVDYAPAPGAFWAYWCQNRIAFSSASLSGNYVLSIQQVNNFASSWFDYYIDEITMRAWMPVFEELAGTNYVICNGNNPHIGFASGTDHYDYIWSPSSGLSCTTCPNPIASAANTYTVSVTPEAGNTCPAKVYEVDVAVANISINGSVTNKICATNTGAVNITPSGGVGPYTYQWSGPSSFNATTEDISNRPAGTYNVTATDANGCSGTASYTISQVYYFVNVTGTVSNTLCSGSTGAVNITLSGGTAPYTYSWTGPGGYTATTEDISNRPAGTYEVSVTDAYGCGGTGSFTINASYSSISITASVSNTVCTANTGSVNITASAGTLPYTYAWAGPSGYTATTEDINNRPAGTYNVTVTDINGCSGTATFTINTANAIINVTGVVTKTSCSSNTGAVNASVSGGTTPYTYAWSGPSSYTATTQDISGRAAGTYTLVVTDASGCTASASFIINTTFPVTETHTTSLCAGTDHGFIDITPNGTAPYTYNWGGGITTQDRIDLVPGTYTVVITDANGCQATVSVTIASNNNCCGGDYFPVKDYNDELTFSNITATQLATMMNLPTSGNAYQLSLGSSYHIAFNGTFTIDQDMSITASSHVTFGPGASIQIEPGKTLTIFGCHLYACDEFLWRGIVVPSNGILKIAQSTLDDAQYGIDANSGAILSVANNTFNKNYVGMFVHRQSAGVTNLGNVTLQLPIRANRFFGGPILAPYPLMAMNEPGIQPNVAHMQGAGHSWTGMLVSGIGMLNVGGGVQFSDRNLFSGLTILPFVDNRLSNGIVSRNSSLNVVNSQFMALLHNNYNTVPSQVPSNGNGIYASGIAGTVFFLPQRSITVTGFGQFDSQRFSFVASDYGIHADRMTVRIMNNLMSNASGLGNIACIRAVNCRSSNVRINNNSINNGIGWGITYEQSDPSLGFDIINNPITSNSSGASAIRLNQVSVPNSLNGFVRNNNQITMQSNAFTGIQINSSRGIRTVNPITLIGTSNFQVSGNVVNMTTPATNFIGYNFSGCNEILDLYNTAAGVDNNIGINNFFGAAIFPVGILYNGTSSSIHRCNTVRNLHYGIRFAAGNIGTTYEGNNFNLNTNDELNFGLHYQNGTMINTQINTRNKWFSTFNNAAAVNQNTGSLLGQRLIVNLTGVTNPHNVTPPPSLGAVVPSSGWVQPFAGLNTADICIQPLPAPPDNDGVLDDYEVEVINDDISFERYSSELKWQATKHIYTMLKADTTLLDSTVNARSFFTSASTSPIAALVNVQRLEWEAMKMDEGTAAELMAIQDSIDTLVSRIVVINNQAESFLDSTEIANDSAAISIIMYNVERAYRDSTYVYDSTLTAYIDSITMFESRWISDTTVYDSLMTEIGESVDIITDLQSYADSLRQDADSLRFERVQEVINANSAIVTTNDIEDGYKIINDIYLNTIALEDSSFDSTQIAYLYYYAFMCPLEGGEATYRARAMLDLIIDTLYLDELYCVSHDSLRMLNKPVVKDKNNKGNDSSAQQLDISMYPNPANNQVTLESNVIVENDLLLTVTDAIGRNVISSQISLAGKYSLKVDGLVNGMYFVTIHDGNNKLFGAKLSIFR